MAEIVRQAQRFSQILVQPQLPRHGAGDLRHFQAVRQACAVMVAFVEQKYLCFIGQAAEGAGMQNAVPVALEH
jgi:hypothetical protein